MSKSSPDPSRTASFARNPQLETALRDFNDLLAPAERQALSQYRMPRYPVVLIMGCPRSGTTLMSQWLASSGAFAYPSNLISRFYGAPHVGAWVQRVLTDPALRFRDEFTDLDNTFQDEPYASDIGKTRGVLAPNVFWHFWRRFFPHQPEGIHHWDEDALAQVDTEQFAAELAAFEAVFDKPLSLKGMRVNANIPFVSSMLDKVLFVFLERNPFYTMQSVLEARERFFGNRDGWWSFKPREYPELVKRGPLTQVAGQVYFTNQSVKQGLEQIEPERWLRVSYEEFCAEPATVWNRLQERLSQQGAERSAPYVGPKTFSHRDVVRISQQDCDALIDAYREFSGEEVEP